GPSQGHPRISGYLLLKQRSFIVKMGSKTDPPSRPRVCARELIQLSFGQSFHTQGLRLASPEPLKFLHLTSPMPHVFERPVQCPLKTLFVFIVKLAPVFIQVQLGIEVPEDAKQTFRRGSCPRDC